MRVLIPPPDGHAKAIAAHVRGLQEDNQDVLYVTSDRPYHTLLSSLVAGGVDPSKLYILDSVTSMGGYQLAEKPANAMFLPSPTMLEMMAMRVAQITAKAGKTWCVLVDSLDTLALYNGAAPVEEFTHYLSNRLRNAGVPGHLIVGESAQGRALRAKIAPFTDEHVSMPRVSSKSLSNPGETNS